jgi:hypothetical protein
MLQLTIVLQNLHVVKIDILLERFDETELIEVELEY